MTEKQTYWLRDENGDYGLATGAEERDRWRARGWSDADEPTGGGFVHARYEGIANAGRFPVGVFREVWSQIGWSPSMPDDPASPVNGDQVAAAPADTSAKATDAAGKSNSSKSAAGGDAKEK